MAKTKKCPVCGISVKLENLPDHVARVHPREDVDLRLSSAEKSEIREATKTEPIRISATGWKIAAAVTIVVVIIAVIAILPPGGGGGVQVGEKAPAFSATSSTGGFISLSDYSGKVVLLDFMDTDCGVCRQHTPQDLVPLHAQYGGTVEFISIDVGWVRDRETGATTDTDEDIAAFKAEMKSTWTYALDKQDLDNLYGVTGTPTTFLVDKEGIVRYRHAGGGATQSILSAEILKLVGG